jgi:four helix bundle protein
MMNEEAVKIRKFTDLKAWQEARVLVKDTYQACSTYPDSEKFGLVSQMKRASVSIASNIAEGFKRETMKDKMHFYVMAHGSLTELQNQFIISNDLGFFTGRPYDEVMTLSEHVDRILTGLIRATKEKI